MSESDRVFPRRERQGAQTPSVEKRLILSAPRRGGPGAGKSRVVEVVHVRHGKSTPAEDNPRPAPCNVPAETWPEGFHSKAALPLPQPDVQPVAPEPAQPVVHVMPMWEPSPQQSAPPVAEPIEPPAETAVAEHRKPRTLKLPAAKTRTRAFADPFADDDGGANCIRCGYLVEHSREKRGFMTCSKCGWPSGRATPAPKLRADGLHRTWWSSGRSKVRAHRAYGRSGRRLL